MPLPGTLGNRTTPCVFHNFLEHRRPDHRLLTRYGRGHIASHHQGQPHLVGNQQSTNCFCRYSSPSNCQPIMHQHKDTGTRHSKWQGIPPAIIAIPPPFPSPLIGGSLPLSTRSIHADHITSRDTSVEGQDGNIPHIALSSPPPLIPINGITTAARSGIPHHSEPKTLTADNGGNGNKCNSKGGSQ